jgi:glycerol-3-phosphate dehydrogenase (NAD(P)+)
MKAAVLGAGSWGTALAIRLAKNNHDVTVWAREKEKAELINSTHENSEYLPDIKIPDSIVFTADFKEAVSQSKFIVMAVPTHSVRQVSKDLAGLVNGQIIINVAKGIENGTLQTMSQVIKSELPDSKVVVLYGPSHAEEVSRDIPTTIVSASDDISAAKTVQDLFMSPFFRVYTNNDVMGVEIAGSIKNVIALCAGISDGLGFGDNTKAALMTRGLAEIARLGIAMGADPLTFAGLSGVGDLIVTCTSMHSRNRRCGILIGQGKTLEEAQEEVHMVVEGVRTTRSAYELSKKLEVEMPITEQAYEILFNNKNPREAVFDLMVRDKKNE